MCAGVTPTPLFLPPPSQRAERDEAERRLLGTVPAALASLLGREATEEGLLRLHASLQVRGGRPWQFVHYRGRETLPARPRPSGRSPSSRAPSSTSCSTSSSRRCAGGGAVGRIRAAYDKPPPPPPSLQLFPGIVVRGLFAPPPDALGRGPGDDVASGGSGSSGSSAAFRLLPPVIRAASAGIAGAAAAAQSLGRGVVQSGVRGLSGLSGRINLEAGLNLLLLRHPQTAIGAAAGGSDTPVPVPVLGGFGGGGGGTPGSPVSRQLPPPPPPSPMVRRTAGREV